MSIGAHTYKDILKKYVEGIEKKLWSFEEALTMVYMDAAGAARSVERAAHERHVKELMDQHAHDVAKVAVGAAGHPTLRMEKRDFCRTAAIQLKANPMVVMEPNGRGDVLPSYYERTEADCWIAAECLWASKPEHL